MEYLLCALLTAASVTDLLAYYGNYEGVKSSTHWEKLLIFQNPCPRSKYGFASLKAVKYLPILAKLWVSSHSTAKIPEQIKIQIQRTIGQNYCLNRLSWSQIN